MRQDTKEAIAEPTGSRWRSIDFVKTWKIGLPVVACCYALYFDGRLKYVGSTNNLRNRFSGHAFRHGYAKNIITPWGDFAITTKITLKFKPSKRYGDWLMHECRLIKRLQPEFNKKLKGRAA